MKNISYDQAMKLIKMYNAKFVDTQLKTDYEKNHIKNSINIPIEEIKKKAYKYLPNKNELLIIYCQSGIRSVVACDMLKRFGYTNLYNIENGLDGRNGEI